MNLECPYDAARREIYGEIGCHGQLICLTKFRKFDRTFYFMRMCVKYKEEQELVKLMFKHVINEGKKDNKKNKVIVFPTIKKNPSIFLSSLQFRLNASDTSDISYAYAFSFDSYLRICEQILDKQTENNKRPIRIIIDDDCYFTQHHTDYVFLIKKGTSLPFSQYMIRKTYYCAKQYIKKRKNVFIILPGYKKKNGGLSDIQLAVTGSTKFIEI